MVFYFFFCLDTKETKSQGWDFQRSIKISHPKRKELASLRQLFFLRIFQLIDARFQILMPVKKAIIIR